MDKNQKNKIVGVITMHRVPNYGSFLQTYATQKVIERLGYECRIIDYIFPNDWQYSHGLINKHRGIKYFIKRVFVFFGILNGRKEHSLNSALKKYCSLTSRSYPSYKSIISSPPIFDIYVTGSDQTWNPRHMKGDSNFLLGFAPLDAKKIAFSVSSSLSGLPEGAITYYKQYLVKYDCISLRECGDVGMIEKLTGKSVQVTLDPTFLLDKLQWASAFGHNDIPLTEEKYILFYMLNYSFEVEPYIYDVLQELQRNTGLTVKSFTKIKRHQKIKYEYVGNSTVEEFVNLFLNSSYVVTSSFHGTSLALNFGIPLVSIVPKNYEQIDSRQATLLKMLNADKSMITVGTDVKSINFNNDNKDIKSRIERLRQYTLQYISDALQ